MMRGRRILAGSLASLLLLSAALPILIATFDWNLLRPALNAQVSAALDRPFAINGELAVVWRREPEVDGWRGLLPWPHVQASDLSLGNPDWAKGSQLVSFRRVEFRLAPLPLLLRRLVIPRIELSAPMASLERLADGRNNWTLDAGKGREPASWTLELGEVVFDQGRISLSDPRLKAHLELQLEPLGKPIPFAEIVGQKAAQMVAKQGQAQDYAFAWRVKGRYQGQALSGSGKVGGLLALQDASKPLPLQADIRVGATHIVLVGTLSDPRNLGAFDLRLRLSGSNMAQLYPLTGMALPETGSYATDGHLSAQLRAPGGALFRYQQFNGRVGASDIHGSLTYVASQPRPKLSGTLTSEQLLFADLAPLIGADSNAAKKARGARSQQPVGKLLPVEKFHTERWRAMDADVQFTGKRIVRSEQLPFSDLHAHVLIDDGVLSLVPLSLGVAGGTLDATVRLNGRAEPLRGQAQLSARHFKLKQLLPDFTPLQTSLGEINGEANLAGTGNSVAELLGSANGEMLLLVNDGTISRRLMEIAGLNLGSYLVTQLFGDREVRINCAMANLQLQDGVARSRLFVLDSETALIHIAGTANFRSERLDLTLSPDSKGMRLFSLRSPLYVRGTFKQPQAGVKVGPLLARGAGVVLLGATVAPVAGLLGMVAPGSARENQCALLLRQFQQFQPPRPQRKVNRL
ncbi:AsmA family protein [Pseudomonas sp.]|uniref:AsmA family protein n=1 Tax=Pseudomonas sp. TaxID=306 RepID=UPI0027351137|nr:AsmA family protein [Pseudomonas sp.]MDP3815202.1 AsmA family protein [Pseudomonas sp.]